MTAVPTPASASAEATDELLASPGAHQPGGGSAGRGKARVGDAARAVSSPWASAVAVILAIVWTVPTLGLLITSFREPRAIQRSGWWTAITNPGGFTLDNYQQALSNDGELAMGQYFLNSMVITIPAVLLPLLLASLAAYAFAWITFPGRDWLFVLVFALQIVPLQVALVPLMQMYVKTGLIGTFWTVWLSHTAFALPLAIFLLHNFMREIPPSLIEAARVDGAGHVRTFFQVLMPLIMPALASFAIFQFLWVWNDLLVALIFMNSPEVRPLTVYIADLTGTRGSAWYLLSAGAFISMIVPVVVFLAMQRYFVRGLLAGGLKG